MFTIDQTIELLLIERTSGSWNTDILFTMWVQLCKQYLLCGETQDGCDLICRCGSKPYDSSMNYHGIGDHQIECPTENDELDERLLPM